MLACLLISFIGSLIGLPFSAARSLGIASLDIGLISAANTGLIARQATGNVPAQCKSICDPVNSQIASYFNCAVCVGNAIEITDYTAPQAFLNSFRQQCASAGVQVPALVFPGQGTAGTVVPTSLPTSARPSSTGPTFITGSAPGIPTPPVPSPTAPVSQQTITTLSSTAESAQTSGASAATSDSACVKYAVSRAAVVLASFFVAAWHLG
ncbi:hypothetical protein LshimejAT787_0101810 [Lyophyllum shimeji]|uniref:Uncharacterized protein n=1 Tax=Lyophyllum shimeji TaxID=47721 RepID=A0A9P3UHT9_LYOSH|nr:hypothetical protein LshimejAT787_0101810 [Lyophyllum shimeji]